jgi:hypothetical protein
LGSSKLNDTSDIVAKETPIINILTYKLPYDLSNQIYNEFQNRYREATYLIANYKTYRNLESNLKTVELLLAMSIFHKRVIANLDGAVKFYGAVTSRSQANIIKMGSYDLTGVEKNKILAVVMSYNKIIERFSIPAYIMEYYETKELLKNLISLKSNLPDAPSQEKITNKRKRKGSGEEDIPF